MGEFADEHINRYLDDPFNDEYGNGWREPKIPQCNRCGSFDVRWRQQTGRWVLFSSEPGKVHECNPPNADAFDVIEE